MGRNYETPPEETFYRDVDRARLSHTWGWLLLLAVLGAIYGLALAAILTVIR